MEEELPCHEGQQMNHGCDKVCNCINGRMECRPRCTGPLVRSTLTSQDPHCFLKPEDECCSKLICSQANGKDGLVADKCEHNNHTYNIGETFEMGCVSFCQCTANGEVMCRPRCPLTNNTNSDSDRCLTVKDKKDPCSTILYCDVNESDDAVLDLEGEDDVEINLISAVPANNSAVILNFDSPLVPEHIHAEISQDKVSWLTAKTAGHIVQDLSSGKTYYFRVVGHNGVSNVVSSTLPKMNVNSSMCEYKGKTYQKEYAHNLNGCHYICTDMHPNFGVHRYLYVYVHYFKGYRLWIEAYLTNRKIKKSNVKDFITKKGPTSSLKPNQGKLEGASLAEVNDYYGPLVGVSILAGIAILVAAGLLVVLARKHGHNKAPITTAVQRKSLPHTAAYDNPSYKTCEGDPANGGRSSHSFEDP